MTAREFRKHRRRLGLSIQEMADEFGLVAAKVYNIETGLVLVPRDVERFLRWEGSLPGRERIIAESGIPVCPTGEALQKAVRAEESYGGMFRGFKELRQHTRACSACRRREMHIARYPTLPEPPATGWMRVVDFLAAGADRLSPRAVLAGAGRSWSAFLAAAVYLLVVMLLYVRLIVTMDEKGWVAVLATGAYVVFSLDRLTSGIRDVPLRWGARFILLGTWCAGTVLSLFPSPTWAGMACAALFIVALAVCGFYVGLVRLWEFREFEDTLPSD